MNRRSFIHYIAAFGPLADSSEEEDNGGLPRFGMELTRSLRKQQRISRFIRLYRRLVRELTNQGLRDIFETKLGLSREAMILEKSVAQTCRQALHTEDVDEKIRLGDEFYFNRAEADYAFDEIQV